MKLSELVDELRENILHDRSDQIAGVTDRLWSDATLVRYINEAQNRFARRGLILRDGSSSEATKITLRTGQSEYALHPSVLAVISGKLESDPADLIRAGHALLNSYRTTEGPFVDPQSFTGLPPGKPLAYSTDEQLKVDDNGSTSLVTLRVYPVPTATYNGQVLRLRVVRMPLEPLVASNLEAVPEIPEMHHLEMLDWAAYLALRMVDVDAGMPNRAQEFAQAFETHVRDARTTAMRKLFAPSGWGFGRNGFAWET